MIVICHEVFRGAWPSKSPDLNPVDTLCSPQWRKNSSYLLHQSRSPQTALTSAWDEFAVKTCANIVGNVHQRLHKYIGARGAIEPTQDLVHTHFNRHVDRMDDDGYRADTYSVTIHFLTECWPSAYSE
ncbi:hypothetical protein KIN20_008330 [Parelaphostrongylus tenuis]|uniref:Uncharacterized protein n=1 Tax=Parelaphostrongylus tenuis TaxID=148309 RepID=A0AAD5MNR5_PARTN|nr:hypothetical protein KIN20_008330 [Parelaphostrongylus tenuis]